MASARFVVHPAVFRLLPGIRIATAVALRLGEPSGDVGAELEEAWRSAAAEGARCGNALGALGPELAGAVHDDLRSSLARAFDPERLVTAVVDEGAPELTW